jgi:hypothetical protein
MVDKQLDPLRQMVYSIFQDVTPVRLRLFLLSNCLAALLFCILSIATVESHHRALQTVGLDAAPSVITAHQIKISVEQMDCDLVDELLYAPRQEEAREIAQDFEKVRSDLSKQLVAAAKNITFGSAEQSPLENIQTGLGQYEMLAQSALLLHNQGREEDALSAYRSALKVLQEQLLPEADALNKANADKLEDTYARAESESALRCGFVLLVGMLLVTLLSYTQFYLSKRFRRLINIPLFVATICTVVFVQHIYTALRENGRELKVAKEDAYNSVVALLDARANSYGAKAAASRSLYIQPKSEAQSQDFVDKATSVASFSAGHNFAETIARAQKQIEEQEKISLPGFKGSLADELNNVRFEGEAQSALESLQAFGDYMDADARVREREKSGAHTAAIKICLGYDPQGSKFPFVKFDNALQRTLAINQNHFKLAIKSAFANLKWLVGQCQLIALLIAVCTYFGLRPRIIEYLQ